MLTRHFVSSDRLIAGESSKSEFPESRPREIEKEVTTLENRLSEVLKNVGKYVLIRGDSIVGYFDSYREAMNAGYKRYGLDSFLVRRVRAKELPIRAMRCGLRKMGAKLVLEKPQKA